MTKYKTKTVIDKKSGRKYTYYYSQYKDQFGKWKYEQAPTKKGLEAKVKKRNEISTKGINSHKQFEEYIENYLRTFHFNKIADNSKSRYLSTLNCHLRGTHLGRTKMYDLTSHMIQDFYNTLSANIAKEVRKIINTSLTHAQYCQDISFSFEPQIFSLPGETPQEKQRKAIRNSVRPLTLEEHKRFITGIKGHPQEALFRMAIDTGMRAGELYALTWADIDFDRQQLSINKSAGYSKGDRDQNQWIIGPVKNNTPRLNKLPKVLIPILNELKHNQNELFEKIGITQEPDTLVFSTFKGTHLDPSTTLKKLKSIYVSFGISDEHVLHDLRHTYATRQFEGGAEPLVVCSLLGHSDVNTTLKTYIHVLKNIRDATANNTDELYAQFSCEE